MNDTKGTISYPVSTRYRENWNDWEAIREIVQNALDSRSYINFDYDLKTKTLIVRDYGEGLELHHLLIGETTKDGQSSIGKFGEGLKFGLLVLVRLGRTVTIRSNNLVMKAKLIYMLGHQTLAIDWEKVAHKDGILGTEVTVKGIPRSYRERFLSLNYLANLQDKVLLDKPGQLFVKGIYVEDIDSIAGYNLNIERENPLSGKVDSWHVNYTIANLIARTTDPAYISMLLQELKTNPKSEKKEFTSGSFHTWAEMHKELWTAAATEVFGSNFCLSTDPELFQEMKRSGYQVIDTPAYFPKGFMPTDLQIIRARGDAKWNPIRFSELSPHQLDNFAKASYLVGRISTFPLSALTIGEFVNNPYTLGAASHQQYIRISTKALDDFADLTLTLIEEVIHYKAGTRDLTPLHEELYNQALAELIKFFTATTPFDYPPDWVETILEQDKEMVNAN